MSATVAEDEIAVGPESDFPPNTHKVVKVRNMEVGIFNVNGSLYGLPNVCPHQYGPLSKGPVGGEMVCNIKTGWHFEWQRQGEILTCPWHGIEFDIKTGRCLAGQRYSVRTFGARVVDGQVYVSLRANRPAAAAAQ